MYGEGDQFVVVEWLGNEKMDWW